MYAYQPLQDALARSDKDSVTLSFAEVERMLGRALPPSARGKVSRQWWANTETHSQALAWLRAGRKAKVKPDAEQVVFIRAQSSADTKEVVDDAEGLDLPLSSTARRLIDDFAEHHQLALPEAAAAILHKVAIDRRRELMNWFERNTVMSDIASADLIRSDRDGR